MTGPPAPSGLLLHAAAATHTGLVRTTNQDRIAVVEGRLFAVADGMGGHRAGEVAAELTVERLGADARDAGVLDARWLGAAVQTANGIVHGRSLSDGALAGMGTTVTALVRTEHGQHPSVAIANVGDSRTYRLRTGELELLTEDHNVVAELVREGAITEEQARTHPRRSVMTRALGVEPVVAVDVIEVDVIAGDRFLLCSDGLHGFVAEGRIAAALRRLADPAEAADELVGLALAVGAPDNVSVVVVDVLADGDAARRASAGVRPTALAPGPRPDPHGDAGSGFGGPGSSGSSGSLGSLGSSGSSAGAGVPLGVPAGVPVGARSAPALTARVAVFVALLGVIVAVAVWAVRLGSSGSSSGPATSVTGTQVSTTLDPFLDVATVAPPALPGTAATVAPPALPGTAATVAPPALPGTAATVAPPGTPGTMPPMTTTGPGGSG